MCLINFEFFYLSDPHWELQGIHRYPWQTPRGRINFVIQMLVSLLGWDFLSTKFTLQLRHLLILILQFGCTTLCMYIYTYKQNRKITSHLITKIHVSRKKVSKFLVLYTYVPPISLSFRIDIVIVPNYFASPLYSWSTRIKPPLNSGKTFTFVIVLAFWVLIVSQHTYVAT